ncbi:hypothetical protein Acr_22g0007780 [Actinidia rufa]|uniref:Uncharacterized protein n=1 Tax=Actinidia rufa TaxID=165716 RepID=A0A7J0GKS2_9ERIC|nr:hypothetical protein Acr_22g0007780 [Actinidia rufa]
MVDLVAKTLQSTEFYLVKDILHSKAFLKCFSLASSQMVSSGEDNAEEKNASNAPHIEADEVILAKFDIKKLAKLAKVKGTKVAKTSPPTRVKGIHFGLRLLKRAKTVRDGTLEAFHPRGKCLCRHLRSNLWTLPSGRHPKMHCLVREMRDGKVIQEVTVSFMRDEVNLAQRTARDFLKRVDKLMADKECSDAVLVKLEREVVNLKKDKVNSNIAIKKLEKEIDLDLAEEDGDAEVDEDGTLKRDATLPIDQVP